MASVDDLENFLSSLTGIGRSVLDNAVGESWDDKEFIRELYEQYLENVQQAHIEPSVTFPTYLRMCLQKLSKELQTIKDQFIKGELESKENAQKLIYVNKRAEACIIDYLELPAEKRLTGV